MALRIPYKSDSFPPARRVPSSGQLPVTWDDILWAAVTVGRPNRTFLFRHGLSSGYEALFRLSLVRSALEQSGALGYRLRRTESFKTLDPTEKGAVNYFLGMTFCKLFASQLLNTPWLLHLDVFGSALGAVLRSRSRPDLIGQEIGNGDWHVFESKGRSARPDSNSKSKAKAQASRLINVSGRTSKLHIGSFTYFKGDTLHFYWRDPQGEGKAIELAEEVSWQHYYSPFIELYWQRIEDTSFDHDQAPVTIPECDVSFAVHPEIAGYVSKSNWTGARQVAEKLSLEFVEAGYQPDGLSVIAGPSWKKPLNQVDTA